ncbi:MAG: PAS domain S-box protein [Thermoplasmata archaeon]|nr:PAS domain S-box protein [Thermoplasmata archaeon]
MPKRKSNEKAEASKNNSEESQERYKILFESATDAIMILDGDSFFDCNEATLKMFGMTKEEFTKVHPSEISPPKQANGKDSRTEANKRISHAFKKGFNKFEWIHRRSNGEDFPVTVWLTAFPLEDRQVLQATVRDITEKMEIEKSLMESEEQLRGIWDSVQTGIVMIDTKTRKIVDINAKALEMIGITRKKAIGKICHEFICPSEEGKCPILDLGQEADDFERVLLTADGRKIPIQKSVTRVKIGENEYILDSFVDITQLKAVEALLEEYEEHLENLVEERTSQLMNAEKEVRRLIQAVDSSMNAVVLFDLDLNVIYANLAFSQLAETTMPEIMKSKVLELIDDEYLDIVMENISQALQGKEVDTFEVQARTSKGRPIWVEIVGSVVYDDSGEPEGILTIIRDITDRKEMIENLIAAEDKFRLLVERANDGILIIQDEKVAYMNPSLVKLSGYLLEEQIGRNFVENVAPEGRAVVEKLFKARMQGKPTPSIYETILLRKDGTRVPVEVNAAAMDYNGQPADFVYLRDLTERKKAEEVIRQSEEKFRKLIETANDAIFLADIETGIITDANKRAETLIGRSRKEIIGMSQTKLHPKGMAKKYKTIFENHIKEGFAIEEEIYALHKDGSKIPISISASTFELNGKPVIQGIFHDLTERKKIQDALQKEKDFSETIVQAADAIIVGLDEKHRIQLFNQGAERITGYTSKDAIGKDWFKLAFKPDMLKEMNKVWKSAWGKSAHSNVNPIWTKSGEKKIITWSNSSIKDEHGKTSMVISIGHDITERQKIQDKLIENEEKLIGFFNSMVDLVFVFDKDEKFTFYHSPEGGALYQQPEMFIGKHHSEVMPPYMVKMLEGAFKKNRKGEPAHIEYNIEIGDNTLWFSGNLSPIFDKGKYNGTIAVVRDITLQKEAEENVQVSEKIYRGLYESTITLADTTDLNEVIAVIAEQARNILEGECSTIYLWNETEKILVPYYTNAEGDKERFMEHKLKIGEGLSGYVAKKKVGSYSNYDDKRKIKGYIPGTGTDKDHLQSIIAEPMIVEGKLVGVINVIAQERKFNDDDLSKMDILAHQATIAYVRSKNLEALTQSEGRFRRMIDNIHDGMTIIEGEKVVFVNDRAMEIYGYSGEELIDMNHLDLIIPEEREQMSQIMENAANSGLILGELEFWIEQKSGERRYIRTRTSTSEEGDSISQFIITTDITERKIAEDEAKRKKMKFLLEDGRAYLVKEFKPGLSLEAFKDLIGIDYPGLFISRTPKKDLNKLVQGPFDHIWLGQKDDDEQVLDNIKTSINAMASKSVILMDRLDYLIFKYGFRESLAFLYSLRDIVYIKEQVLVLSIDPFSINEEEMALIEKEMSEIEQRQVPRPNEEQFEIIEKIYERNSTGIKPSFSEIGTELGLSKPTFRKRVRSLIAGGYVVELTKGNKKVLELTQRGRSLFFK